MIEYSNVDALLILNAIEGLGLKRLSLIHI